MDWSEKNLCIKCNKGVNLLVCSENGCPLAIHEGCMACPARFDDAGQFYCPYCLYKRAVAESRQAREYALARKKALLIFMDEEKRGTEENLEESKRAENNGHNQPKVGAANVNMKTCDDVKLKSNIDCVLDQSIHLDEEQKASDTEEENIEEEESQPSAGSKDQEPSLKMHGEQKISNAEEKQIQQEQHETSSASGGQGPSLKMHEHKICNAEEEEKVEESETSSASTGQDPSLNVHARRHKRGSKREEAIEGNLVKQYDKNKKTSQYDKNKKTSPTVNTRSSRRSSSALRTDKVVIEKVDASRRSKQPQQSSVKLANDAFGRGKRKRLFWREDEEEMLEAGVQKFAKEANKNLPWRKILEFGQHVFDGSRTPNDLRDKWRNMLAK